MFKNVIKLLLMILGNGILVVGIIGEIDGIGRFAMIASGLLFSVTGGCMPFSKMRK